MSHSSMITATVTTTTSLVERIRALGPPQAMANAGQIEDIRMVQYKVSPQRTSAVEHQSDIPLQPQQEMSDICSGPTTNNRSRTTILQYITRPYAIPARSNVSIASMKPSAHSLTLRTQQTLFGYPTFDSRTTRLNHSSNASFVSNSVSARQTRSIYFEVS